MIRKEKKILLRKSVWKLLVLSSNFYIR